jgi:hypothetical protein
VRDDASSPHKICISQLAFFTGKPRLAPRFVRELAQAKDGSETLSAWVDALPDNLRGVLEGAIGLIPECDEIALDDFRLWLPDTTKFLFHRAD